MVCRVGVKWTDGSAVDVGCAVRVVRRRSRARGVLAQGSRLSYLLAIHRAVSQTSGRAPSAARYPRKTAITRRFSRYCNLTSGTFSRLTDVMFRFGAVLDMIRFEIFGFRHCSGNSERKWIGEKSAG